MDKQKNPPVFTHTSSGISEKMLGRGKNRSGKYEADHALIISARVAIDNALADEQIGARLNDFGYDPERLMSGLFLSESLRAAIDNRMMVVGSQRQGTEYLREKRAEARRLYNKTLQLARMAFGQDPGAREALALGGRRKQNLAGWLKQALAFYDNLLERDEFRHALNEYNHDSSRLREERIAVGQVQLIYSQLELKKGDARTATARLNEARSALKAWMGDFRRIAKLAFPDEPGKLTGLGLK